LGTTILGNPHVVNKCVGKEVTFAVHKNFDDINEEEIQVQLPNFDIQNQGFQA